MIDGWPVFVALIRPIAWLPQRGRSFRPGGLRRLVRLLLRRDGHSPIREWRMSVSGNIWPQSRELAWLAMPTLWRANLSREFAPSRFRQLRPLRFYESMRR